MVYLIPSRGTANLVTFELLRGLSPPRFPLNPPLTSLAFSTCDRRSHSQTSRVPVRRTVFAGRLRTVFFLRLHWSWRATLLGWFLDEFASSIERVSRFCPKSNSYSVKHALRWRFRSRYRCFSIGPFVVPFVFGLRFRLFLLLGWTVLFRGAVTRSPFDFGSDRWSGTLFSRKRSVFSHYGPRTDDRVSLPRTVVNTPCRILYRTMRRAEKNYFSFSRISHSSDRPLVSSEQSLLRLVARRAHRCKRVIAVFFSLEKRRSGTASGQQISASYIFWPCDDHTTINPDVSRPVWPGTGSQRRYILRIGPRSMAPGWIAGNATQVRRRLSLLLVRR